jgi:hypothetical protein
VERRLFLVAAEVPGLLSGSLRGDVVALRRILGGRRGGRIGAGLALATLALAAPTPASAGLTIALWLALCTAGTVLHRSASGLSLREWLRLSLWTAAPALLVAAVLRLLWPGSALPLLVAVVAGHVLLWRGVRWGLG